MTVANGSVGFRQPAPRDAEMHQLLHPARCYARPADVVADERLTIAERRAILSSWASDACAVESNPPLRRWPFADGPATFDAIMDALLQLDRLEGATATAAVKPRRRRKAAYFADRMRLPQREALSGAA